MNIQQKSVYSQRETNLYNNGSDSADELKMEIIFRIQLSCSILRYRCVQKCDEQIKMNGI